MNRDRLKFLWRSGLEYFINAKTIHDLDAPFVFNLTRSLYDKSKDSSRRIDIEKRRSELKKDQTTLEREDPGQGSIHAKLNTKKVKVSSWIRSSAISPYYGRILSRLVKFLNPSCMIELGTAAGISGSYLSSGADQASLITIEGDPAIARIAHLTFDHLAMANIKLIPEVFESALPAILTSHAPDLIFIDGNHQSIALSQYIDQVYSKLAPGVSTIIIDDIRWNEDMYSEWKKLSKDTRWQISIDLLRIGILIKNPNILQHHNYKIIHFFLKPWRLGIMR
ncbi:MAG: class I SAM-dependent methyltransferase [Saprospiraceae bacterium]